MNYDSYRNRHADVSELLGKVLKSANKIQNEQQEDQIVFELEDGTKFVMYHSQDCCEDVHVDSIVGDLSDLVGSPITLSECITHENVNPEGVQPPEYQDSFTWTFYKFATVKGYVDIRWHGNSNGYYSEQVSFQQVVE